MSDYKCPKCNVTDEEGWFSVEGTAMFVVDEDGVSDYFDPEWDNISQMWCRTCGHGGTVKDFTTTEEEMAS